MEKQPEQDPITYPAEFRAYIQVFREAGKALNRIDVARAHAAWTGLAASQWPLATSDAQRLATERSTRFLPMPVNHLMSEGWTRRTTPLPTKPACGSCHGTGEVWRKTERGAVIARCECPDGARPGLAVDLEFSSLEMRDQFGDSWMDVCA